MTAGNDRPDFWDFGCDPYMAGRLDRLRARPDGLRLQNEAAWRDLAYAETKNSGGEVEFGALSTRLPDDLPRLEIALPTGNWPAPDFFRIGVFDFASARLREAMALGPDAAQYLDLKLLAAGPEALAQDYRMLRPLAHQPAMDGARSKFNTRTIEIPGRGNQTNISSMSSFVVRADLVPVADLFWTEEEPTMLLAVDALAARVMRARCTGICFQDPKTIGTLNGPIRLRTAKGIRVKILG